MFGRERDTSEVSHSVVKDDKGHWNLFNPQGKFHLSDFGAVHVSINSGSHDVVNGVLHHELGQLIDSLSIDPQKILSIFLITFPS